MKNTKSKGKALRHSHTHLANSGVWWRNKGHKTQVKGYTRVYKGKQGNNQTGASDISRRLLGEDMGSSTMDKIDGP